MISQHTAFIAIGSNLGDRAAVIASALVALRRTPGIAAVRESRVIETEAVGPAGQGRYLNAAAELRTTLQPRELLEALLRIERDHGRDRSASARWGPRTLDLDLLLFDDRIIREDRLTVPHPHLHERMFVLEPLADIAADVVHPVLGRSVRSLREQLRGMRGP